MRPVPACVLVALLLLPVAASADYGATHERVVKRVLGTPTPLGPAFVLSDETSWRADVPPGTVVFVEGSANATSPFYLRCKPLGTPDTFLALPATHQGCLLSPGSWRVAVDPAGGALVNVRVRFTGHVGEITGIAAPFSLRNLTADGGCVIAGVCLP